MEAGSNDPLPLCGSGEDNPGQHDEIANYLAYRDWEKAFNRAFLYLQALKIPVAEGLGIALEALNRAGLQQKKARGNPPTLEVMRILRGLLSERYPFLTSEFLIQTTPPEKEDLHGIHSMPAMNRGVMVPDGIDFSPWRTFLLRCFRKNAGIKTSQLRILALLIILLTVLVFLAFCN